MNAAQTVEALQKKFGTAITGTAEFRGEHSVQIELSALKAVMRHCREDLGFDYLVDASSVDNLGSEPRFTMVYELYGYSHGQHLRVRTDVSEDESVPTVSDIWATANWHEREVFDMMGIDFAGHPDLRRILMWEGYPFHPLRKDFPLEGKPSDMPEVAFTGIAPLEGGPFVTCSGGDTVSREPRSRTALK